MNYYNKIKEKTIDIKINSTNESIIERDVNKYINSIKNNFKTNINVSTKEIKSDNINYMKAKQTDIFKKIRSSIGKFKTRIFRNIQTKEDIMVSNVDINKDIDMILKNPTQKSLINEHIAVYNYINEVIANANKIAFSNDKKLRIQYDSWNYYVTPIKIDNKKYIIEFDTVKNNNIWHFRLKRLYLLSDKKKALVAVG